MKNTSLATPTPVAVIGAGPVGLFSVFTCGMMRLRCTVFDTLPHIGGQCQELYPDKPIYDIPGFTHVTGQDLVSHLSAQAKPFDPLWHLGRTVTSLKHDQGAWHLHTDQGEDMAFKAVILAAGAGTFAPHRPPLSNLDAFEGKSVFYAVRSVEAFKDKDIVIAGGGDSAVDWALSLHRVARSVILVHRRDTFRAAPDSVEALEKLIKDGGITLYAPYQLSSLDGDLETGALKTITLKSLQGASKTISAQILLPFFGLKAHIGPLKDWGLTLDKNKVVIDPTTAQTNLDGLYAVGDIATYAFKRTLILTGFAEAAQAAFAIYRQLSNGTMAPLGHSTTRGIPSIHQA